MIPEQVKQIYAAFKKLLAEESPAIYKRLFAKRIVPLRDPGWPVSIRTWKVADAFGASDAGVKC